MRRKRHPKRAQRVYLVKQFNAEAQRRKDAERTKNFIDLLQWHNQITY
jgi:hypothetical protein